MTQDQLVQVLKALYPAAVQTADYVASVDVSGNATISLWNPALGAAPTSDALATQLATLQLQQAQATQTAILAQASIAAQTSGFTSSALGSAYSYPSGVQDQANLTSVVTASLISPAGTTFLFWCKSPAGVEAFVSHTAAQIQQVGLDGMAAIMAAKQKQATLTAQVAAATTVSAVQAVVWS